MKRNEQSVLLAAVLALALAACTTTRTGGEMAGGAGDTAAPASSVGTGADTPTDSGAMGSTGTAGTTCAAGAAPTAQTTQSGTTQGATTGGAGSTGTAIQTAPATPNSTVVSIEVIPRQAGGAATGAGTVAGAAVGGTTGTGTTGATMTGDRVYRITLRMDDGRTQTITQEWAPSFTNGDRVRMVNGAIQR